MNNLTSQKLTPFFIVSVKTVRDWSLRLQGAPNQGESHVSVTKAFKRLASWIVNILNWVLEAAFFFLTGSSVVWRLRAQTYSLCHCLRNGNNARTHGIGEAAALSVGPALKHCLQCSSTSRQRKVFRAQTKKGLTDPVLSLGELWARRLWLRPSP